MAAGEDQPEALVGARGDRARGLVVSGARAHGPLVTGLPGRLATEPVEGAVARDDGEPPAGVGRHALRGPAPHGLDEGLLGHLLGEVEVAEAAVREATTRPNSAR